MFGTNGKEHNPRGQHLPLVGSRPLLKPKLAGGAGTKQFYDGETTGGAGASVGDTEMYPYVSFTISIDG